MTPWPDFLARIGTCFVTARQNYERGERYSANLEWAARVYTQVLGSRNKEVVILLEAAILQVVFDEAGKLYAELYEVRLSEFSQERRGAALLAKLMDV